MDRKYKQLGIDALEDKRGIRNGLSKEEILIKENKGFKVELLLIKNLKELERGVV